MQPGFRLLIESGNNSIETIENEIKKWGGKYLEEVHNEYNLRYSISRMIPKTNITQNALIQIKKNLSDKKIDTEDTLSILIEIGLMIDQDEDPENHTQSLPKYHNLRPQAIVPNIISTGNWFRNGNPITTVPIEVNYDEVEDWWDSVTLERGKIAQIIVGFDLNGDLPAKDPKVLATILSGFAKVYYPASAATMELMNDTMGSLKAPRGSIRIILDDNAKQPLYTPERISDIEKISKRPYELDIFLRLAKKTLLNKPPIWIEETLYSKAKTLNKHKKNLAIDRSGKNEKKFEQKYQQLENELSIIEDAYNTVEIEKAALFEEIKEKNNLIESNNEEKSDLISEIDNLDIEVENLKEINSQYRIDKREMKKEKKIQDETIRQLNDQFKVLEPILKDFKYQNKIETIDELFTELRKTLLEEDEEDEIEEIFESVESVLLLLRDDPEWKKKFVISKSAIESGKASTFNWPRRVLEAFEMMERSYDTILNKEKSNQRYDFQTVFRSDTSHGSFETANKESGNTMKKYGKQRNFLVNGEMREMQSHIKLGGTKNNSKCLRIHFIFDKKSEKFLIGHCGNHLSI
tara:strand:+ start:109 stop:1842 length:1734 start_codon:yes stop_codon:yes gene_type:complete